ncbi:uncharacterized protein LOC129619152 [Condylostylus longicornis]|uniref:uncharacterized protein LOC129619152 n=1 Tax=Condylostylus longicornis TaxID=2530218 RepID=UPI00244E1E09|nr:uncharacterized protein LOC129619152 [Condylostylus longicornis]
MISISKVILIFAICNFLSAIEAFKLIKTDNFESNKINFQNFNSTSKFILDNGEKKFYEFGNRITGDKMKGEVKEKFTFPSLTNKEITLSFPDDNGKQFRITQIRIYVDQSSTEGAAHIIDGGIDENFIKIEVKAEQTMYFSYLAECYGY